MIDFRVWIFCEYRCQSSKKEFNRYNLCGLLRFLFYKKGLGTSDIIDKYIRYLIVDRIEKY